MCKKMNIFEVAWHSTLQIVISPSKDRQTIMSVGSGFFLEHHSRLFFVTADHCLHCDDYEVESSERMGTEYYVSIVNNIPMKKDGQLGMQITPIANFTFYDELHLHTSSYNGDDIIQGIDVELQDATFSEVKSIPMIITTNFDDDNLGVHISKGDPITYIRSEAATEPHDDDYYLVMGCIHNKILQQPTGNPILTRESTCHVNLRYIGEDCEGNYKLRPEDYPVDGANWHGISGAPVLGGHGRLLGILVAGSKEANYVSVYPIKKLLDLIDKSLAIEEQK